MYNNTCRGVISVILIIFVGTTNLSGQSASAVYDLGNNYFGAGIKQQEFDYRAAPMHQGRQRQQNWCWAACIQMVLNYHGLQIRQEQIVRRIFGYLVDMPATPSQIMEAISGWGPTVRGAQLSVKSQYGIYSPIDLINYLSGKWPLIVGLENPDQQTAHAYVLTAIYYTNGGRNLPVIDKVVLRDPYPSHPSRLVMDWEEFVNRNPVYFKVWIQEGW